jgi:hypothetical protein
MGETTQQHSALNGDIAGRPPTGPERTLLSGMHLAPVGERAGLKQPMLSLVEGDTSGPRPVPGDAAA